MEGIRKSFAFRVVTDLQPQPELPGHGVDPSPASQTRGVEVELKAIGDAHRVGKNASFHAYRVRKIDLQRLPMTEVVRRKAALEELGRRPARCKESREQERRSYGVPREAKRKET